MIKEKSAVEITVTYSVTTVGTASETITDIFESASTVVEISGELHTVFVDATTNSFIFTFDFNFTKQFTRVADVTFLNTLSICEILSSIKIKILGNCFSFDSVHYNNGWRCNFDDR